MVGVGFGGERKDFDAARAQRLQRVAADTTDLLKARPRDKAAFARFTLPDSGGALVGYESTFASIELAADKFDAYLAEEGLDAPRAARAEKASGAAKVRERYARCPKTWIAGTDAARVTGAMGLPLEIVPLSDPSRDALLIVEVRFRGKPLAGSLVRAWNRELAGDGRPFAAGARDSIGPVAESRTDENGRVALFADRGGEWMVATVHMVPCPDPRQADWESWWASLTFARPPVPVKRIGQ
jgi:uncharacterized GH25 family protein